MTRSELVRLLFVVRSLYLPIGRSARAVSLTYNQSVTALPNQSSKTTHPREGAGDRHRPRDRGSRPQLGVLAFCTLSVAHRIRTCSILVRGCFTAYTPLRSFSPYLCHWLFGTSEENLSRRQQSSATLSSVASPVDPPRTSVSIPPPSSATLKSALTTKMHVVIIHPEQWNGGSDRCTVALIRHFVSKGYKVTWLTTMIDEYWKDHKFDGVDIREVGLKLHPGDWWSQNVALGWYLVLNNIKPDLVVIDHSASCVPLIKWRYPKCKVLFYCHFPQQLVTPSRFFLYRWYSNLIGLIEEQLFEQTDVIMVNSHFTATQFSRVMPRIEKSKIRVVYPPCDVDSIVISAEKPMSRRDRPQNDVYIFMSMNRFWPEKRLDIIIEAASLLKKRGYKFLVQLAGSVMPHIPESRIYYELLQKMTRDLDVTDVVHFIPSPSECRKFELYRQCDSALYTPPNEHFGIVPIEALDQRRPVIVCDSGGPAETVIEDVTGSKILKPTGELLAEAMVHHIKKQEWPALDCDETYEKQRARFDRDFSLRGFCAHIDEAVAQLFPDLAAISSRNRRALA